MWLSALVLLFVSMNNYFRCAGFLLIALLSACDGDKPPVPAPAPTPTPKVAAESGPVETKTVALPAVNTTTPAADAAAPFTSEAPTAPFKQMEREPVHVLAPNVAVVPVVAAQSQPSSTKKLVTGKASVSAAPGKSKAEAATNRSRAPIASKTKPASEVVQQTRLTKPTLDLSLPSEVVDLMQPPGKVAPITNKAVLPSMFGEKKSTKDTPFQLNGRLLSNELQLQRRDEDRRSVEGAALDFEFKQ
ncbi:translation initiation factor 2 [Pseudomonas sp.]|uniref:translation initiation factor 2 n=1 Tax=Pseudomonas sp. TaxID=306 RepID=UPI00261CD2C9|nr:translation initiation factor 2 [Pseudomonas sp.]